MYTHIYIYILYHVCILCVCIYIYIHDIKHQNCSYDFVVGVLVLWDRWSTLIIRLRLVSIPFLWDPKMTRSRTKASWCIDCVFYLRRNGTHDDWSSECKRLNGNGDSAPPIVTSCNTTGWCTKPSKKQQTNTDLPAASPHFAAYLGVK